MSSNWQGSMHLVQAPGGMPLLFVLPYHTTHDPLIHGDPNLPYFNCFTPFIFLTSTLDVFKPLG
jgi:hypothetical protein